MLFSFTQCISEMNAQITKSEKVNAKEQKPQNLLSERERERNILAMSVHEREREREKNVIH